MLLAVAAAAAAGFPVPSRLPPRSWETVGHRVFIHGCKSDGLLNTSEVELVAKYTLMTVEKGQGQATPGPAEPKMEAVSQQYKAQRPSGFSIFYINAVFDWGMFAMHDIMNDHPEFWLYNTTRQPALMRGDPTFPQPSDGMHIFNWSSPAARSMFVSECVNATLRGFDGCFIDGASSAASALRGARLPKKMTDAGIDAAIMRGQEAGEALLLAELQAAVGSGNLIVAKDGGGVYTDGQYVNTLFMSDAFCSQYNGEWTNSTAQACVEQISAAVAAAERGQAVLMHGEANARDRGSPEAEEAAARFALAAFLVAARDTSLFGYSDGWYFSGSRWWPQYYDQPLGAPRGPAVRAAGAGGGVAFRRDFDHASVSVDVTGHTANITFRDRAEA